MAYGGTELVLDGLARGLQAAGHEVVLFATGDSECEVPIASHFESGRGVPGMNPQNELAQMLFAYELAAAQGFDIIHDHTVTGPMFAAWKSISNVVTTNHGPFNDELAAIYKVIDGRVPLIAISHHQASTSGKVPVAAVIHHGVDPDLFPVGNGDGGYALFLGRMHPNKGVHTAIDAAREAEVPLVIAARMRGPDEVGYFENTVKPILGSRA